MQGGCAGQSAREERLTAQATAAGLFLPLGAPWLRWRCPLLCRSALFACTLYRCTQRCALRTAWWRRACQQHLASRHGAGAPLAACVAVQLISSQFSSAVACSVVQPCASCCRRAGGLGAAALSRLRRLRCRMFSAAGWRRLGLVDPACWGQVEGARWAALKFIGPGWHRKGSRGMAEGGMQPCSCQTAQCVPTRLAAADPTRVATTCAGLPRLPHAPARGARQPAPALTLGSSAKAWVWGQLFAVGIRAGSSSRIASLSACTPASTSAACDTRRHREAGAGLESAT